MTIDEIRKKYPKFDIPTPTGHPVFSRIQVWRIPTEEKTAGGLFVPDTAKSPRSRGVLLAAGLKAMDELTDHGICIGDIVTFGEYAGAEKTVKENEGKTPDRILVMNSGDILESEGLLARVQAKETWIERYDSGHFFACKVPRETPPSIRSDPKGRI